MYGLPESMIDNERGERAIHGTSTISFDAISHRWTAGTLMLLQIINAHRRCRIKCRELLSGYSNCTNSLYYILYSLALS